MLTDKERLDLLFSMPFTSKALDDNIKRIASEASLDCLLNCHTLECESCYLAEKYIPSIRGKISKKAVSEYFEDNPELLI